MKILLKKYISIIIVLAISFLSAFILLNKNILFSNNFIYCLEDFVNKKNQSSNSYIETDDIIQNNFINFGKDLSCISKSKFMILSHNLKKKLEIKHNFNFPVVKNSKYKSLIFDSDGKNYIVTSKSKILYEGKLDQKIITAKISERDNIVFLTESDEYCCEIRVLTLNGNEKFRYCFAKFYLTDVSINDKGNKVAICGLISENNKIKSIIQIFDIDTGSSIFCKEFENNKFLSINFFNNKNLMAIGSNIAVSIKNLGKRTKTFDYFKKNLCFYSFDKNSGAALSFSPTNDGRNQYILILNKNCKQKSKIETEKKLKSLCFKNGTILALSDSQSLVYKFNGKICYQKKVPINCKKVTYCNGSKFYVLGNTISTMSFK